jgi:hypothetical protein
MQVNASTERPAAKRLDESRSSNLLVLGEPGRLKYWAMVPLAGM